jgi:hypothetical protein
MKYINTYLQQNNKCTILVIYPSTLQLLHVSKYVVRHHHDAFFDVSCRVTLKPRVDLWCMPRSLHPAVVRNKTLKYK